MADQINILIEAVRAVSTNIQKTQTYRDGNQPSLGGDSVEVSASSGAIGGIAVDVQFDGTVAAVSSASGTMNASYFWGIVSAVSTATGVLVVPTGLTGTVAAVSSATAAPLRDFRETLVGSAGGVSAASATIILNAVNVDASISAASAATGSLTLAWALVGSSDTISIVGPTQLFINGVA